MYSIINRNQTQDNSNSKDHMFQGNSNSNTHVGNLKKLK